MKNIYEDCLHRQWWAKKHIWLQKMLWHYDCTDGLLTVNDIIFSENIEKSITNIKSKYLVASWWMYSESKSLSGGQNSNYIWDCKGQITKRKCNLIIRLTKCKKAAGILARTYSVIFNKKSFHLQDNSA